MQEHTTSVDGVPVRWLEHGSGTPVVLVHGLATSPAVWRHVLPRLIGLRLLAYELTGYGSSIGAGVDTGIGLGAQADRLQSGLGLLGIDRAVLVGHDVGAGGVVQVAAVRTPIACSGLLLANGVGYEAWTIPTVEALRAAEPLLDRLHPALLRTAFASLCAEGHADPAVARESLDLHFAPDVELDGAAALLRQAASLDVADTATVAAGLPTLSRPARVVPSATHGQQADDADRFATDLRTTVVRVDGGRRCIPEDRPDVLATEIAALAGETISPRNQPEESLRNGGWA